FPCCQTRLLPPVFSLAGCYMTPRGLEFSLASFVCRSPAIHQKTSTVFSRVEQHTAAMAKFLCLLLFLVTSSAHKVQNVVLRGSKQRLRVCNAYAYEAAVDVLLGKEKVSGEKPLPYKQCSDFQVMLKVNDKLEFRIGNATTGTFSVSDLPSSDALLLLVVYRHDVESTAVSFESHIFLPEKAAQVALIDTFLGTSDNQPFITDGNQTEKLRFGRVVSVSPGNYLVKLQRGNKTEASTAVKAREGENQVVLRVGIRAEHGPSFPEELLTFPEPQGVFLKSGAGAVRLALPVLLGLALSQALP
ncbi:unnamed protein product, partial [Effrenium voratum]